MQLFSRLSICILFFTLFTSNKVNAQNTAPKGFKIVQDLRNTQNSSDKIDFYVKISPDPCSPTSLVKSLYAFDVINFDKNSYQYLNFKIQVVDCNGRIVEQTISRETKNLDNGFNKSPDWELSGTLHKNPYAINYSYYSDNTKDKIIGQIKPADPDSIVVLNNKDKIFYGEDVELMIKGGNELNSNENVFNTYWSWHIGSPTGTEIKTKERTLVVKPIITTTYYLSAVTPAPNSATSKTISKTIIVDNKSATPDKVIGKEIICSLDDSTTLQVVGGRLGRAAKWVWYQNGCGTKANEVIAGKDIIKVLPKISAAYFVRAEGPDGITDCKKILITVLDPPQKPDQITASKNQICNGEEVELQLLGQKSDNSDNSRWQWYEKYESNIAGVYKTINNKLIYVTGPNANIRPKQSSEYYAVSEGGVCKSLISASTSIKVDQKSTQTKIVSMPLSNTKNKFELTASNNELGDGSKWIWYEDNLEKNNKIGEGSSIVLKSNKSTERNIIITGEGKCDNPPVENGSYTLFKTPPPPPHTSGFYVNYGYSTTDSKNLASNMYTIGYYNPDAKGAWSGYYFKYITGSGSITPSKDLVADDQTNSITNYPSDGTYYKFNSNAITYNANSYIIGWMVGSKNANIYLGLGYGEAVQLWGYDKYDMAKRTLISSDYVKNTSKSFSGLSSEIGLMFRVGPLNLIGGIGAIFGSEDNSSTSSSSSSSTSKSKTFVDAHFGIGITILSRK
jgi:hypothetical protein